MTVGSPPPRVSVVIPAYNAALTLEAAVKSVQGQTRSDWELIVVNDGSADQTGMLAAALASRDARIRVVWQANQGLGPARNAGVAASSGEFLLFLDADDWIEPATLERLVGRADRISADVVIGGWVRETVGGEVVARRRDILRKGEWTRERVLHYAFASQMNLMACGTLIRRRLVESHGLAFRPVLHEDMYFMIRVYLHAACIGVVPHAFYHWMVRDGSITSSFTEAHADGYFGALIDRRSLLHEQGLLETYEPRLLCALAIHLRNAAERVEALPPEQQAPMWESLTRYAEAFPERARWPEVLPADDMKRLGPAIARWMPEAPRSTPSARRGGRATTG